MTPIDRYRLANITTDGITLGEYLKLAEGKIYHPDQTSGGWEELVRDLVALEERGWITITLKRGKIPTQQRRTARGYLPALRRRAKR